MRERVNEVDITIFSTCPQSKDVERSAYRQRVIDVARWSEQAGCEGILVYTDNGIGDPWVVSQTILANTERIAPLVAVQPVYMHPYAVAKLISTIGLLFGRRLYLNMLAGGFKNDLTALGDQTEHDHRYRRTTEYTQIVTQLLASESPVSYEGHYYSIEGARLLPGLPADLQPGILISGSSEAGRQAAKDIGATAVQYPKPVHEYRDDAAGLEVPAGVRVGIIARETSDEAWRVAHDRFPPDRKGQIAHQLAMNVSDSVWHRQLSEAAEAAGGQNPTTPYWMHPFENYQTFCPYLVGDFDEVGRELENYIDAGSSTFILDIPPDQAELEYVNEAFTIARRGPSPKEGTALL